MKERRQNTIQKYVENKIRSECISESLPDHSCQ